jgi:hypothetical protein
LTILGYKCTGRAKGTELPNKYNVVDIIMKLRDKYSINISVDTLLASKYQADLDRVGIDRRLYDTTEGNYGMYVDAVEMKAGRSSYDVVLYDIDPNHIETSLMSIYATM